MERDPYLLAKKKLAREAVSQVLSGMTLGLGSGSTSKEFIYALAKVIQNQSVVDIYAVASSRDSYELAQRLGIPLIESENFSEIDLVVDGADEIDSQLRMIKGGGGAVFREKILLQSAKRSIILADESKSVSILGSFGVPLEIAPFGKLATVFEITRLGYQGKWRCTETGEPFVTDNGNYIYDIHLPKKFPSPEEDLRKLLQIRGIIEVGFVIENVEVWFGNNQGQIYKKHFGAA
ncbi:ribose 5-phosphate isomerase A [Chlamydia sp. 17-3921]|uniref:ribose 5-phosphate isomerase A n=1 Tax=Chlamydia sp. 17-3921 TaxID=2675798 RepID=UPI0019183948|nr:ribose 5-phosphate isomerase A [Chlamydia sp. 17-3921]